MDKENAFLYQDLTPYDQVIFAKAIQISLQLMGKENCWCLKRNNHAIFQGFTTNKANRLFYKGRDARPLLLSIAGCNSPSAESVIVRKSICTSKYCLNPSHYYWGTRSDVAYENAQRRNNGVNTSLITKLRQEKELGTSSLKLSKTYRIPYHIVRRICNYETYEEINNEDNSQEIWKNIDLTCQYLTTNYNTEAKKFNLNYHVTNELECPWHQKGSPKHKGNFGAMGECLDCMEEIKKGRCEIDVTNFDFRWYWQVKRFWEQVDIGEKDECWVWQGATRKNNTESTAYFPSPFHSAKTQSAARIAFWLSRGYTGKYRIFNKKTCKTFCCNPTHLTIKELKNNEHPNEIERIRLNHGNIFEHYKKRQNSLQGK
jgi:hypothetical protein